MSTYCILTSKSDDWGQTTDRFKTRQEADDRLRELIAAGRRPRLVRWDAGEPIEMEPVPRPSATGR